MNASANKSDQERRLQEVRKLQSWVRRYAQNRSVPMAIFLIVFTLLWAAIGAPAYLAGVAFREGNPALGVICIVVMFAAVVATIYISVPGWGGRRLQLLSQRWYESQGQVTIAPAHPNTRGGSFLAAALLVCVATTVILGVFGYLPIEYLQPISALYVVPFLVGLNFLMRPITGYVPLLWPLLYAIHAVLIVAGAPILFAAPWDFLNMLVPTVGYGLITALACHLYSRWALHRAREIVSHQLEGAKLMTEGDEE